MTRFLHDMKTMVSFHELTEYDTPLAGDGDTLDGKFRSVAIVRSDAGRIQFVFAKRVFPDGDCLV